MGEDKIDHLGVGDFFVVADEDIFIVDEMKIVGAPDLLADTIGSFTDSLTETHKLIGIGFIPNLGEFGINAQMAVLKDFACVDVEHRHCPLGYESGMEVAAGGLGGDDAIGCTRESAVVVRLLGPHPCK